VNLWFTTSPGGAKWTTSAFSINGNAAEDGYNTFGAFQDVGYDASTWDSAGKLNIFPAFNVADPTNGQAGDVHSFAIFDQVPRFFHFFDC